MKRKLGLLLICSAFLSGMTVQADDVNIVHDSRTVIYSGEISPVTHGIIMVVKKGEPVKDNNNLYMIMNGFSDDEGKIEFEFDIFTLVLVFRPTSPPT